MKRNSMAQALSQAAGHSFSRPPQHEVIPAFSAAAPIAHPVTPLAPSRIGKKPITGFFEPEVSRQIKKLGLDQNKTMQSLLQEAFNDLFRKYDLPPVA